MNVHDHDCYGSYSTEPVQIVIVSVPSNPCELLHASLVLCHARFTHPSNSLNNEIARNSLRLQVFSRLIGPRLDFANEMDDLDICKGIKQTAAKILGDKGDELVISLGKMQPLVLRPCAVIPVDDVLVTDALPVQHTWVRLISDQLKQIIHHLPIGLDDHKARIELPPSRIEAATRCHGRHMRFVKQVVNVCRNNHIRVKIYELIELSQSKYAQFEKSIIPIRRSVNLILMTYVCSRRYRGIK